MNAKSLMPNGASKDAVEQMLLAVNVVSAS